MSKEDGTASVVSSLAGRVRGSESTETGDLVRPEEGERPMAGPDAKHRGAERDSLSAAPHPQAALPPAAPRFTTAVEVDAATVDLIIKQHALALLRSEGYSANDADYYARAEVLRVDSGGVVVKVRR